MTDREHRDVPVHRLRPNETVWTPPSVIFFDTETTWRTDPDGETHTLRLWVAQHVDRRQIRKRSGPVCWGRGTTAAELAEWVTGRTRGRDCVWMYAHNLNFDLAVTDLPAMMVAEGWEVTDFSVGRGAPWLRLSRAGKTLTMVDSWAWLPESLASVAARMGGHKVELPADDDTGEMWDARCAGDVDLLARAVLDLMAWWDRERLGRWSISGAGSGWNAMRHTPTLERHVIDTDPEAVAFDRLAVRGGRKDAAVVRSATGGPWVELDFEGAYPTVARDLPTPVKRAWEFDSLPTDSRWIHSGRYGPVAEAVVSTDRPRFPVRWGGVSWFPVGTFRTVLAGPELAWAAELGCLRSVGRGQMHKLGRALTPWAAWVLDPSRGGTVDVPAVARVATKVWGRSVLGKFAARGHTAMALEGPAVGGWGYVDCWDAQAGRRGADVTMGGRRWLVTFDGDTENCYPAVLAWVESAVRVRLGRVLEALDGVWWTADTDGLLVDMTAPTAWAMLGAVAVGGLPRDPMGLAEAVCRELAGMVAPLRMRPKRVFDSLAVLGPQHVTVGGVRKMSGVSARAEEVAPNRFRALDWPGLKWQMANGRPGSYRRPLRTATFSAPTVHRWVLDGGETRPVVMRMDETGENVMVPWSETGWAAAGDRLAEIQYPRLAKLV